MVNVPGTIGITDTNNLGTIRWNNQVLSAQIRQQGINYGSPQLHKRRSAVQIRSAQTTDVILRSSSPLRNLNLNLNLNITLVIVPTIFTFLIRA